MLSLILASTRSLDRYYEFLRRYSAVPRSFSIRQVARSSMRLLLVEDDRMIGESVKAGLRQDAFTVDWVRDAEAADLALAAGTYALVLLDLGLPGRGGLQWLKDLRSRGQAIPVLILTARDAVSDRVAGLR